MFSPDQETQIKNKGIALEQVTQQIDHFKKGFPFCQLVAPATPHNGIIQIASKTISEYIERYNILQQGLDITKFVPASGAASRMFKALFEFRDRYNKEAITLDIIANKPELQAIYEILSQLHNFAFYPALEKQLATQGTHSAELLKTGQTAQLIDSILSVHGLNYGQLPKGLIEFHAYPEGVRTPFEEHLVEAAAYCKNDNHEANLHFTVSPEHLPLFQELLNKKLSVYEKELNCKLNIRFSEQKPSTDTLAVTPDNQPFINDHNELVFRPGGHGALIENLNELEADIVFIKNIDNVVPDALKPTTYQYKKALGGLLLNVQSLIFEYLQQLDQADVTDQELEEMLNYAKAQLLIQLPDTIEEMNRIEKIDFLFNLFNRPIRICGMVKNQGEPGGGPFWVKDEQGQITLQIVEASQINKQDPGQQAILAKATHFNPVDLICTLKNYAGQAFDLHDYIDPETGFISVKSYQGSPLKAQELPGLWNGAMARWITLFAEVPVETFNPVKTLNDLLRPAHR